MGDVLLSLPALTALARHFGDACLTLVGNPDPLGLIAPNLPVEGVIPGSSSRWTPLWVPASAPLPPELRSFLAGFEMGVLFSPRPRPELTSRWREAGMRHTLWVCSIPDDDQRPVGRVQADCLVRADITVQSPRCPLLLPAPDNRPDRLWLAAVPRDDAGPLIALAPGSGSQKKNWPLEQFMALAHRLRQEIRGRIAWVIGPGEEKLERRLRLAETATDLWWAHLPLATLAAGLQRCQVYVGNDSGVTHLAAATDGPAVVAIFGPTDPRVWAPPGEQVRICRTPLTCAPCSQGRAITCPDPVCLAEIAVEEVMATLRLLLKIPGV